MRDVYTSTVILPSSNSLSKRFICSAYSVGGGVAKDAPVEAPAPPANWVGVDARAPREAPPPCPRPPPPPALPPAVSVVLYCLNAAESRMH